MLHKRDSTQTRRGVIAVMAAFFLIMVFAFTAFSIDTGYMTIVHQELLSAVDAAALASAQELRSAPAEGMAQVKTAAIDVAAANDVNGKSLQLVRDDDIEVGIWDPDAGEFVPLVGNDISVANAVRITGRLSRQRGNPVALFFAPVIDYDNFEMSESAIAAYGAGIPRDVVLVIDCSGSMAQNNRMTYTRPAALALIDELGEDDRLSLVVYSYPIPVEQAALLGPEMPLFARIAPPTGELFFKPKKKKGEGGGGGETRLSGYLEHALNTSFEPVRNRIPDLTPALYAGGTNIAGGLRVAIEELLGNPRNNVNSGDYEKVIVLMTDGHANHVEPPGTSAVNSIYHYVSVAEQNDIVIHGITLGTGAAQQPIRDAAETTGGEYHHVADGDLVSLFEVYRALGRGTGSHLVR